MKLVFEALLFSVGLIYCLYVDYFLWLKPKDYMKNIHKRRNHLKSQFPFLPDWFVGYIFFYEQPQISIWWGRIMMLIATLICSGGLAAAIHGPF
jgi:hypothetical protein